MDDTRIFGNAYDHGDVGADADLNNLGTTMNVSPILTTRIDKDHPKDQIIGVTPSNLSMQRNVEYPRRYIIGSIAQDLRTTTKRV
ncbi:hypothetical protein Tco_0395140, partial [Tanacetum coccineum]